jgi:hypothetical protein
LADDTSPTRRRTWDFDLPAAPPPAQGDDMKDDEDMPDVLQRAQPDDIIKPLAAVGGAQKRERGEVG